jgi:hypothetical protein
LVAGDACANGAKRTAALAAAGISNFFILIS